MGLIPIPTAILIIIFIIVVVVAVGFLVFVGLINFKPKQEQNEKNEAYEEGKQEGKAIGEQVKARQEAVKRRAGSDDGSA